MPKKEKQVKVSFTYDRLWEQKLSQIYHLLVPSEKSVIITEPSSNEIIEKISVNENSSYLYESVIGSIEKK